MKSRGRWSGGVPAWYTAGVVSLCMSLTSCAALRSQRAENDEETTMETVRARICLNGVWELHEGGGPDEVPAAGWRPVRVPEEFGDWSRESCWYRLRFDVPASFAGKRVELEIGRVRFYGKAIVNGVVCGESWQPRIPLAADITNAVRVGQTNELLAYAHCLAEGYSNPGTPLTEAMARGVLLDYYDAADMAGIFGDVFLSCRPTLAVTDVHVMPSVRNGELRVRAWITNDGAEAAEVTLACGVQRKGRTELSLPQVPVQVAPGETREVELAAKWADPVLWGTPPFGEPVLYHLQSELRVGERVVDRRYDRFGFRELWVEGNAFLCNGKPIHLMGVHASDFEMREAATLLIPKLQQAGFLFVHPHAANHLESFYDVCDELGMMVWDGTFCGGPIGSAYGRWGGDRLEALRAARPYMEETYRQWVRTNRNHPSIVMWSAGCANEAINEELQSAIEEEDPTRPVVGYGTPKDEREVQMLGFRGWQGPEPDYSAGIEYIQQFLDRRGERKYPLWIGEYWSQSGRPRAMEISYEMGMAGGCTFDVGGYKGCFPPFFEDFEVTWPSVSGVGQRRHSLLLRGHKKTFPETRHLNWCDEAKPVFAGEWDEEAGYRAVGEKANGKTGVASVRVPETIVTVSRAGEPVAGKYVFLLPAEGQSTNPVGVLTDPEGRAWFVLEEPGKYRVSCGAAETTFEASNQALKLEPGYDYIQWVSLGD